MPCQPAQKNISSTTVSSCNKPQLEFKQGYGAFIFNQMDFKLLKEFLKSDTTQKDFAKSKNLSSAAIACKLNREMRILLKTKVIDGESIVCDTSMIIYDVRRNKENWLKAINAYEQTMATPVNLENDNRKISDLTVSEFVGILRALNAL